MSAETMKLKFVCCPSMSQLSLHPMHTFSFKFDTCFPWITRSDCFLNAWKKYLISSSVCHLAHWRFWLLLDYVGRAHKIKIRTSSVRVPIISEPNRQILFQILAVASPEPYARRNNIISSAWLCQQSSCNCNLSICRPSSVHDTIISEPNALISFKFWWLLPLSHTPGHSFSLTWDPMGFGIFEILKTEILTIFFRKFQIHHCTLWRNQKNSIIWKTSDRRVKRSEIWDSGITLGYIRTTSGTLATCQVSCPNMAILKRGPYLGNRCP